MVKFEKFEVFHCESKGRGIRAIELLEPGEELLTEKPIVYTLSDGSIRGSRCDYCFSESVKLLRCSKCKYVSYCNQICQAAHWTVHKRECKCLVKVAPKRPPNICRLVSHILFKYYSETNVNSDLIATIQNLTSNAENISNSRKEAFFTFGAVLYDYLEDFSFDFKDIDVYSLFCRISCNSFTITNHELNSIGTGVYKTVSFINHSCDPNCIAIFNGPDISIRSIKQINPGEELVLSYVNILSPSEVRALDLKEGYMFDCSCHFCSDNQLNDFLMKSFKCDACGNLLSLTKIRDGSGVKVCTCEKKCQVNDALLQKAITIMDELDGVYNSIHVIPTTQQQETLKKLLCKGEQILGPFNLSLLHCYEVAMDGCLERSNWKGALDYGKTLLEPYQEYLTKYHPTIGLHYFKLGKLELQLDHLREGISYLQNAHTVLSISHGKRHELVNMLGGILSNAYAEMSM